MTYDTWLCTNTKMERDEDFADSALKWAEDEDYEYEDEEELVHAYADYCEWCYERHVDRQIDEAWEAYCK